MTTKERIVEIVSEQGQISAKDIIDTIGISEQAVFRHLKDLIEDNKLIKRGSTPFVLYSLAPTPDEEVIRPNVPDEFVEVIEKNFLHITALGEYLPGMTGFLRWCEERNLDVTSQARQYVMILEEAQAHTDERLDLIDAFYKFNSTFDEVFLDGLYYVDFYSLPQFGKTKLGQLLLYAKQSQDKARIREIAKTTLPYTKKLMDTLGVDAVGFIPPTIKRETQFMKDLQTQWALNAPTIKLIKLKTEIVIPQKSLKKMEDRIANAANTIIYRDDRKFKHILLVDDAVGSGATLNETARQIKQKLPDCKVTGLVITGSYKGFEVISEV